MDDECALYIERRNARGYSFTATVAIYGPRMARIIIPGSTW